jgi:HEAT repeat protein
MKYRMNSLTTLFIMVVFANTVSRADDAEILARIDKQLAELKTFRYEGNGDAIRDLETMILQLPIGSPLNAKIEKKLIDAMGPSNDIGRGIICRQLRVIGTDQCIAAVAPMLSDPKQTDAARLVLQGIGSKAATKVMHEALPHATGAVQVGLINSLAKLGYEPLRSDCIRLISSEDPAVAGAAIRALGKLGGVESLQALIQSKNKLNAQLATEVDLALISGADQLVRAGEEKKAKEYFSMLYKQAGQSRLAALRGLVMADPDDSADIVLEAMRSTDSHLAMYAINLAAYGTSKEATAKFVSVLDELPRPAKIVLLHSLGKRGDGSAAPAIARATKSDNSSIRQAALESLGGLAGEQAIDTLLEVAVNGAQADRRLARASLLLVGDAEPRLAETARGSNEKLAVEAIRALASRKAAGQSELIMQLTHDDNQLKRAAAIDALGVLIDEKSVDAIVKLALEEKRSGDLKDIDRALGRVLLRIERPEERARPILEALPSAAKNVRPYLIRQLSKAGTNEALVAAREAIKSEDLDSSDAAVSALAQWPNKMAGDDLVRLFESARTSELRNAALNGFLRMATESDDPSAMLLGALKQITDVDKQKRVLEAIGNYCDSFDAIKAMQSLLDQPELKTTAALATVRIADKLRSSQEGKARTVLEDLIAKINDPAVQSSGQEVLNEIDKYQDHIMQWVIIGPFGDKSIETGEQSYKTVYEPEQVDTSKLDWKPLKIGLGRWDINLEATFGPMDHRCAYVRTMVWSPKDQDVLIEGGCDDALRMWVNGQLVFDDYSVRGGSPRKMRAPAKLREGWNELKLKAVDHEGGWAFGCRIRKPNGTKLDGLKYEAR